ncbi:MAG: MerR family transcriptional regulator [Anaerolineae bacterium]
MKNTITGLNIKAVAERTGVPLHTLRAWERRYGVPRPGRVPGNHYRVYDEQDIADVLWMKRQVEAGVSPAQASAMLEQQTHPVPAESTTAGQPIVAIQSALLNALLVSDQIGAQQLLDQAFALFSPEQIAVHLIQPTMAEIGQRWMNNQITIGQEHFASNLIRQRLLAIVQGQPTLPITAPRLVAACAPAEQHELGLLLFALLAQRQGWQVLYLGQRTPLADLARWAHVSRLIVLTIATVNGLASLIPLWNEANRPAATLVFGGVLFSHLPILREHIPGAYLGDDGVEAVRALATSDTRVSQWKPEPHVLQAALTLQDQRLRLTDATLSGLAVLERAGEFVPRHSLVDPTLFLVDAVASALAFETPGLMDLQGAWIRNLMTAHGVDPRMLQHHLQSFVGGCRQVLEREQVRLINPLVERLLVSAGQHSAQTDFSSR